ncbi:MAG: hypothetical protein IKQ56_01160 [Lachnospiraceae bacterium]|nr:hypothetical protein [Lachnospiraceae bacterium]
MSGEKEAYEKEFQRLKKLREQHKGEWLTYEIAMDYYHRAESIPCNDRSDTGIRNVLRKEIQEKYGVTEIEAVNILSGYFIADYAERYRRIKELDVPRSMLSVDEIFMKILKNLDSSIKRMDDWIYDDD